MADFMDGLTCEDCRFWQLTDGPFNWGSCRRQPPHPEFGWPGTNGTHDWCGELEVPRGD